MNAAPHLSQPQISHSSIPPSQQYQSHIDHQTSSVPQIAYHSPPISNQLSSLDWTQLLQGSLQPTINFKLALIRETKPPFKTAGLLCNNFKGGKDKVMLVLAIKPKRPRNAVWFKEKAMLAEAQESGQILDEEQLAFLADPGILDGQAAQTTIPNTIAFQTEDLDAYDSDCDDVSNAKAVLMANLSNSGSDVISKAVVQHTNLYARQDSMILSVIEQMSEQMINHVNNLEKANEEKNNESLTAQLERYKEREKLTLKQQIDSIKQNLSNQIKEKESLLQTFTVFKNESKEKESKYMDNEIALEKKIKELDNTVYKVGQSGQTVHMLTKPQVFYDDTHKQALGYQNPFYLKKAQRIKPTLYDEEVSRSKMLAKQNDPISKEKKINTTLINYVELNRLSEDFGERFVPQQELSAEQAFLLQTSHPNTDQSDISPVKIEAPNVSLVNTSLKKLKYDLGQFDTVVKKRITP
ncbi:hypothetical protein Tco_1165572 [Tanacetum coccineum]